MRTSWTALYAGLALLAACGGETTGQTIIQTCADATDCSGHGACDLTGEEAQCACDVGWAGATCDVCATGYHPSDDGGCVANEVCTNKSCLSGVCVDATGVVECHCYPGWTGTTCNSCANGYHDDGNGICVGDEVCTDSSCAHDGTCNDDDGMVTCVCKEGYTGPACEACAEGYHFAGDGSCVADEDCGGSPCGPHGSCEDDGGVVDCICDTGWTGDGCDLCYPGYHDEDGDCVLDTACGPQTCAGHGLCSAAGGEVTCVCDDGYTGLACTSCAAGYHRDEDDACVPDETCEGDTSCLPNGYCEVDDGVASCTCFLGWDGPECSLCAPGYHDSDGDCVLDQQCLPSTCGGHGACDDEGGVVTCLCEEGYVGNWCEACDDGYHLESVPDDGGGGGGGFVTGSLGVCVADESCLADDPCGEHGACDDSTGVITCACDDGYAGLNCELCAAGFHLEDGLCVLDAQCLPTTCSGHGVCTAENGQTSCECYEGYVGDACASCAEGLHFNVDGECVEGSGNPLALIVIRDADNGGGEVANDYALVVGDSLTFYAAGYDTELNYVGDVSVVWSTGGSLPSIQAGPQPSFTYTATAAGTSGRVRASFADPEVAGDETGIISVTAAPPGDPSVTESSITALPTSIIANGSSTSTVTVILRDEHGTVLTSPHTVVIQTTAGILTGAPVQHGDGSYTQTLRSSVTVETATLTATVDGQAIDDTATVAFVAATDLVGVGVTTIDCDNYPSYKGQNLLIQNGTVEINSRGCSPMEFGSVTLHNNSGNPCVLTHAAATADDWQKIDVQVTSLHIEPGCKIDVTAKGFLGAVAGAQARTQGNTPLAGALANVGGTHGGLGAGVTEAGRAYGGVRNPAEPGAGGGEYNTNAGEYGGAGGGLVRVHVLTGGYLVDDGAIYADGQTRSPNRASGGAGGGVLLNTPRLLGAGVITANGGGAHTSYGKGGGGGRIAVTGLLGTGGVSGTFAPGNALNSMQARGGVGQGGAGGAGTVWVRYAGDIDGRLFVANADQPSADGSTPLFCVPEGTVDDYDSAGFDDLDGNLRPDLYAGTQVNVDIHANETPGFADDPIFTVLGNDAFRVNLAQSPLGQTHVDAVYRGVEVVDRLIVTDNGHLDARGCDLWVKNGGQGDPTLLAIEGQLWVTRADLGPVETIAVTGGGLVVEESLVGSNDDAFPFDLSLNGGVSSIPQPTLSLLRAEGGAKLTTVAMTVLDDATITGASAVTAEEITVHGDARADLGSTITAEGLSVDGTLLLTDAGTTLTQPETGAGPNERGLVVEVGTLSLQGGAVIDVSAKGWAGGSGSRLNGYAMVAGLEAPAACGGSHGGVSRASCAIPSYDSLYRPRHNGAGGGRATSYDHAGGAGGGSVTLKAQVVAHLNGAVRANGGNGVGRAGGGAGGSIYVEAPTIDGSGPLEAYGGAHTSSYAYGGGGGMIAVVASSTIHGALGDNGVPNDNQPWTAVKIYGGQGASNVYGGAGTFYRRVGDADGDLLVDNADHASDVGSTPLVFQGLATFGAINATSMTSSAAFDLTGAKDDYLLNPHVGQGTPSLADDHVYRITDTAGPVLVFTGTPDPSTFATAGTSRWSAFYRFDNLEVRGHASLAADAEVRVDEGDMASRDDTSFRLRGTLDIRTLDLNATTAIELIAGTAAGLVYETLIQGDITDYTFGWTLNDGTVMAPSLHGASMTASGAHVTVGGVELSGDATLSGATSMVVDTLYVGGDATLSSGTTLEINAEDLEVDGALTIADAGTVVSHGATAAGPERRLTIHTTTLTMTSGGAIDVTGRGFAGGTGARLTGYAPLANLEAAAACGGSHGGTTAPSCTSLSYDSLYHPRHNGAGGGRAVSYDHAGGAGGGSVEIFATTVAHLDGAIRANGTNGVGRAGGGAGGSIYVSAPLIDGGGALEAFGGAHTSSYAYGGGGGMIALVAANGIHGVLGGGAGDANTPWTVVKVYGGQGASGTWAGSGTFYRRVGGARGDLLVDNADHATFGGSTPLVFQGSGPSTALTPTQLTASTLFDTLGSKDDYLVNPKSGQGTVSLGDDVIYTITQTAGSKLTIAGTPDPTTVATAGDTWTAFYRFENVEVRGRAQVYADAEMRVDDGDIASGDDTTFRLRGRLDVRTLDLNEVVRIELVDNAAGELATDTLIQGDNTEFDFDWVLNDGVFQKPTISGASISASGARVEVETMDITGDASFTDGSSVTAGTMDIGGNAVITGSTVAVDTLEVGGNATISGGSAVTVNDDILAVDGTLTIADTGTVVSHGATGEGPERRLRVEAHIVAMAQGGAIDVTGKGWAGGTGSRLTGYAPLTALEAAAACGGTHGGLSASSCTAPTYDSLYHPVHNGAGGGRAVSYDHAGGAGGGSVEIVAVSAAHLNGVIRANGANGVGRAGGGAGGSIYVTAPLIDGSGALEAYGGAHTSSYAYGGGGGMIALNAGIGLQGVLGDAPGGTNQPWSVVKVHGGQGASGVFGGSGTFYRRVGGADGDLLLDNGGHGSFAGSTALVFQGSGLTTLLTATSLDGGTLFDGAGGIDDYLINPKAGQGTASLGDDHVYRIVDTNGSRLTLSGSPDPTTFAAPGSTWTAFYRFDNLEVRGGARLLADAELRVDAGDMSSGDATSLRLRGEVDVRTLDVAGVTAIELVDGAAAGLVADSLVQGAATDYSFAWTVNDGAVDLPGLHAISLSADGGAIAADLVDVDGDLDLIATTISADVVNVGSDLMMASATHADIGALDVDGDATLTSTADAVVGTFDVGGNAGLSGGAKLEIGATRFHVEGALTISDANTVLSHTATAAGPERRLRVEAATLTMASDGAIDVSGKGWGGGTGSRLNGYAALSVLEAPAACGGSHGGFSYSGACALPTFDSLYHPLRNGSGGGRATSYDHAGGAGGGAVEIIVGSAAHLNGHIRANGGNAVGRAAGGAGGAIYVQAPFVDGTGRLEAFGGNGANSYSYGGGGGMIAVVASGGIQGALGDTVAAGDNQPWTLVNVQGGLGTGNMYGGSGTFYRRVGASDGDLMLDNGGHGTASGSTRLVFEGSGLMTQLTATSLAAPAAFDLEGDLDDYLVNPKLGQGQTTLGDDKLYRITSSSGNTLTFTGSPDPTSFVTPATDRWTAAYRFDNLEIRGGASLAGDVELRVDAGDMASEDAATLVLGGDVSVRTLDVGDTQTLSIKALDVATLIGGAAPGTVDPRLDWAIGGGSVELGAVVARDLTITGATFVAESIDATGLVTLAGATGTVGTVAAGDLTLSGTTALTVTGDDVDVEDALWLTDSATLTHPPAAGATVRRLVIEAGVVTVDPSAAIDVSHKGWAGGTGTIPLAESWPAGATSYGPGTLTGGCHGGLGYVGSGGTACISYGRFDDAWWPGSGGGRYNTTTSYRGGNGGGVVHITASDVIILHGAIKADGEYACAGRGGGGAGGAVFLSAPNIGGNGTVSARGGDAHPSYGAGGGGGGRIVVTGYDVAGGSFGLAAPWANLTAAGGSASGARAGGAGTIFMRPRGYSVGTLVVDNDDKAAAAASTVLASIGAGTAANVTATTFTDATKTWPVPDYYVGTHFRANVAGNATPTLDDDVVSSVAGNTAIRLTSSDLPAGLATGASYRGFVALDQLEVRGGAQLALTGDLIVYNGDVSSATPALAVGTGASVTVSHQLELDGVDQAAITGTVSAAPLVCSDCP